MFNKALRSNPPPAGASVGEQHEAAAGAACGGLLEAAPADAIEDRVGAFAVADLARRTRELAASSRHGTLGPEGLGEGSSSGKRVAEYDSDSR